MKHTIIIAQTDENRDTYMFRVAVDGREYSVAVPKAYYLELTSGKVLPAELVRKSFEFLLEREGPDSILPVFELPLINRYFPGYESAIKQ